MLMLLANVLCPIIPGLALWHSFNYLHIKYLFANMFITNNDEAWISEKLTEFKSTLLAKLSDEAVKITKSQEISEDQLLY